MSRSLRRGLLLFAILLVLCINVAESINEPPTNIIVKHNGVPVSSLEFMIYTDIGTIKLSCTDKNVHWSISPALPEKLNLISGTGAITGMVTELLETTQFTITATNDSGSNSTVFPITITECNRGTLLFPRVNEGDSGWLQINKGTTIVYGKQVTESIPVCLVEDDYTYSFNCQKTDTSFCGLLLEDSNSNVYLLSKARKGKIDEGVLTFTVTSAPTPILQENPVLVQLHKESAIYFSVSTVFTGNLTFSPALPSTIHYDRIRSALVGQWTEEGIYKYTAECRNAMGTGKLEFTVAVGVCLDPAFSYLRLFIEERSVNIQLNLTNSRNEIVYQFSGKDLLDHPFCIAQDDYLLDIQMNRISSESENRSVMIYDKTDAILGNYGFTYEANKSKYTARHHFSIRHSIPERSTLRFTKSSVGSKWMERKFKDASWKEGSFGNWGVFDAERIYFRKMFTLPTKFTYAHVLLDVLSNNPITVYLNGDQVVQADQFNPSGFTRFSLPISTVEKGENLLAVMVKRTSSQATDPVLFDLHLQPLASPCIRYILSGTASDDLEHPDPRNPASHAFDNNPFSLWRSNAVPSTLFYTFDQNRYEMINSIDFYIPVGESYPTSFTVVGIRGTERVVLKEVTSTTFFKAHGWTTLSFSNKQAFNQYAIVFNAISEGTEFAIGEVIPSSCNELYCKKKIGYPSIATGSTHYKKCPLGSVGTRQMKCVDMDNEPEWVDDRSSCLQILPEKGFAYVDTSFILYNVTYSAWKSEIMHGIEEIITDYLYVRKNETAYTFMRDITTESMLQVAFSLRFTLDEQLGDYIKTHTHYLINDFNSLLTKQFGRKYHGISIQVEKGPSLYEPLHWSKIITYTVLIGIICSLTGLLYFRSGKKSTRKSLYSSKKGHLLAEE